MSITKLRSHLACGMLLAATAAPARGGADLELARAIPADAIGVWLLQPTARTPEAATQPHNAIDIAALLIERGRQMGLLPKLEGTAGWLAEGLAVLPDVAAYPRAVVLIDVTATRLPDGGHRLAGIQAALLLLTRGDNIAVERRIQAMLNLHTNSIHSRLDSPDTEGQRRHRLMDSRLPDWAPFEWGAVGEFYIVAAGTGAFDRIAGGIRQPPSAAPASTRLADDAWFQQAHARCRGSAARWEWYFDFAHLRQALAPVMPEKVGEVLDGLRLNEVSRGLWTIGPDCRAVDAACMLRIGERDRYVPITVIGEEAARFDAVIPPQATSAAIIRARPQDLIERFRGAYLSSRSPSHARRLRERWAAMETELGVQAESELFSHLGEHVIIHDYPPHPLRLPILKTLLIEIGGSGEAVRAALDRLLGRAQDAIRELAGAGQASILSALKLERDPDGVWYFQLGLYGPALAVTNRWVILSHSPSAVRQNVRYITGGPEGSREQP